MKTTLSLTGWPRHLVTTFNRLHEADACTEGYSKLAGYIRDQFGQTPKDFGMDREIPLAMVAESNGLADTIWTLRNAVERGPEFDRFCRLLACDFAEHALPIWAKRYPDDHRPSDCIAMARAFARGECTATELAEARRAAYAAADAAAAATDAAYAAAAAAAAAAAYAAYAAARLTEKQWQLDRLSAALLEERARCSATAVTAEQRVGSEAVEVAPGVFDVEGLES